MGSQLCRRYGPRRTTRTRSRWLTRPRRSCGQQRRTRWKRLTNELSQTSAQTRPFPKWCVSDQSHGTPVISLFLRVVVAYRFGVGLSGVGSSPCDSLLNVRVLLCRDVGNNSLSVLSVLAASHSQ